MVETALTIPLLFLIGYTAQRASVCMVVAAREIVEDRRANRLTGFLLAAAFSALAMAASMVVGRDPFSMIPGYPASFAAIAGGALFAVGAVINRHCAMGTLAALAAGELHLVATLAGMIAAVGIATPIVHTAIAIMADPPATPSMLAGLPVTTIAAGATIAAILLAALLRRNLQRAPTPQLWSPLMAMGVIGVASGLLFALEQQWPYTSLITRLAAGQTGDAVMQVGGFLILAAGMVAGAWTARLVRIRRGTARQWVRAGTGGLLMGVGASFVPGGNDAMLMTGVPLLLPNLLVAYAAMVATLLPIEWWRHRISGRPAPA